MAHDRQDLAKFAGAILYQLTIDRSRPESGTLEDGIISVLENLLDTAGRFVPERKTLTVPPAKGRLERCACGKCDGWHRRNAPTGNA